LLKITKIVTLHLKI